MDQPEFAHLHSPEEVEKAAQRAADNLALRVGTVLDECERLGVSEQLLGHGAGLALDELLRVAAMQAADGLFPISTLQLVVKLEALRAQIIARAAEASLDQFRVEIAKLGDDKYLPQNGGRDRDGGSSKGWR